MTTGKEADRRVAKWLIVGVVATFIWIGFLLWAVSNEDNGPNEFERRCDEVGGYVIDVNGGKGSDIRCLVDTEIQP